MCGIAAIYNYARGVPVDPQELLRIRDGMICRGPDGAGVWSSPDERLRLAHRRLAIIDLSPRGAQPMVLAGSDIVITYNGEIYNFRELRQQLMAKGHRFHTESDTEVMLVLYREHGPAMVDQLRGMFAFALWDGRKKALLLARDPFGIKPLYYALDSGTCRVASEVKALLRSEAVDRSPNAAGHAGFFLWGHVPEPHTLYQGIRALPAGSTLWIDEYGPGAIQRYSNISDLVRTGTPRSGASQSDAEAIIAAALRDSVRQHLVADVDVGVFLSSGLDSTTIATLAAENSARLRTVTLGFEEFKGTEHDEVPLAEEIARKIKSDHQTIWVREEDFRAGCEQFLSRMDQPTIDGLNTYFVSRAAASAGMKVALSGLGGDELFAGYPGFRDIPRLTALTGAIPGHRIIGHALRSAVAPVIGAFASPKYASLLEYGGDTASAYFLRRGLFMPWELSQVMDPAMAVAGLEALRLREDLSAGVEGISASRHQITALEATLYMRNQLLRDTDWASMSHSVEVRVPLLDRPLWRATLDLAAVPGLRIDKQLMAKSANLPQSILNRPKTGFSVPVRDWLLGASGTAYSGRRLRGWAQFIYDHSLAGDGGSPLRGQQGSGSFWSPLSNKKPAIDRTVERVHGK